MIADQLSQRQLDLAVMYIFVDESGTFTAPKSADVDSWCVVAAYTSPEGDQERLKALVMQLRQDCGSDTEVKIDQLSEGRYIRFLRDLSRLTGLLFAVAVDVSLHSKTAVEAHRDAQADKVIEHRSKMVHATARDSRSGSIIIATQRHPPNLHQSSCAYYPGVQSAGRQEGMQLPNLDEQSSALCGGQPPISKVGVLWWAWCVSTNTLFKDVYTG